MPKEIRITQPHKRNEEQKNNKINSNITYKHNPNKHIWYPVLHHQGVWTYNQIEENFNETSWEVDRKKTEENELSDDESIPDLFIKNNGDTSMSDDDTTIDNDIVRNNDFNETTNINKDIKENKSVTNNEGKKRSDNDLTSVTNVSNKDIKEDKRITKNKEEEEKRTTSDNSSNSSSEIKIDNMTFGNELSQIKK